MTAQRTRSEADHASWLNQLGVDTPWLDDTHTLSRLAFPDSLCKAYEAGDTVWLVEEVIDHALHCGNEQAAELVNFKTERESLGVWYCGRVVLIGDDVKEDGADRYELSIVLDGDRHTTTLIDGSRYDWREDVARALEWFIRNAEEETAAALVEALAYDADGFIVIADSLDPANTDRDSFDIPYLNRDPAA